MLAFIDSPVQIAVVMIVVLLVFGPDKMRDIGKQLGRAIREIRRAGADFRSTLEGDDTRFDPDYKPARIDSYGNSYDSRNDYTAYYDKPTVPEEDLKPAIAAAESEQRGDFAASALSDSAPDYGMPHTVSSPSAESGAGIMPVYGVLETPAEAVSRDKSTVR